MKIFIAWEYFLEQTFLDYMLGTASMSGKTIVRFVNPLDITHANSLLVGNNTVARALLPSIASTSCSMRAIRFAPRCAHSSVKPMFERC